MTQDKHNESNKKKIKELCRFMDDDEFLARTDSIDKIENDLADDGIDTTAFIQKLEARIEGAVDQPVQEQVKEKNPVFEYLEAVFRRSGPIWKVAIPLVVLIIGISVVRQYGDMAFNDDRQRGFDQSRLPHYGHPDQKSLSELNQTIIKLHAQQQYKRALQLAPEIINLVESSSELDPSDKASSYNNLAVVYKETDKFVEAEQFYKRALQIQEINLKEGHGDTLTTMNNLGLLYEDSKQLDKAEKVYLKMVELCQRVYGEEHRQTIIWKKNLIEFYKVKEQ